MGRAAVRSYANIASMPSSLASHPNGTVCWSIADGGFVLRTAGVWNLLPVPIVPAGTITLAMLANMNTDRLLGRDTAGAGVVEEIAAGNGVEFDGAGGIRRSALAGGDVTAAAGSAVTLLGQVVDGSKTANVAEGAVVGGTPVVHMIDVPDGVTGDVDVVLTNKTRVLDVLVIKKVGAGGAGDTIQLKNGANPISDAMSINVADQAVVRSATMDDAFFEIAALGTLRVTRTKIAAVNVACLVVVTGVRVA